MFPQGVNPAILLNRAQQLLREALDLSQSIGSWEFAGIQAHRLAGLLDKDGLYDDAGALYEKAITYSARAGDHTRVWTAYCYLADRAMKRNDGQTALSHLEKAAREWIREKVGLGFHAALGSDILLLGTAALQTVAMGADAIGAVAVVESLKAATTAASLARGMPVQPKGQQDQQSSAGHLQELIQQREELRLQMIGSPNDAALAAQLQQIQAAVQEERQKLSLRDPRFGQWVDATDIDLTDGPTLLSKLAQFGPKTTLMGLLDVHDQVWTYMVWEGGSIVCQRPKPLRGVTDGTAQNGEVGDRNLVPPKLNKGATQSTDPWDTQYLAKLAEAILVPLDKRLNELGPEDRLIISTSGELSRVPFAALPHNGTALCTHVNISFIQGLGVLEACLARPDRDFHSALCLGGPSRSDLPELFGALAEVNEIKALFTSLGRKASIFTGAQATVHALKSNAEQFDVIHIACHALAADSPDGLSSLMLAPAPTDKDSGNLAEDRVLSEIQLLPGCFVNLAGCSTGTQLDSDAPLLGGLIPAFLIAGAASVLGSLWPIQDLTAARFQTEFYRQLLGGNAPAESLSKTQRECIDGMLGQEMLSPSLWAGFVLYGVG
jgi:CHAT domain-containing protein